MTDRFCGNCGAALRGTAFCTSCGAAVNRTPDAWSEAAYSEQSPTTEQPTRPALVNPFAGVPRSDIARDVAAAVLLVLALLSDWDLVDALGGEQWWVVVSALLSLGSLTMPYLLAAGALRGVGPHESVLLKAGLNVPLLVSVLTAYIVSGANFDDAFTGYVGPSVAFALAGAAFAVQPRQIEHGPSSAVWGRLAVVAGGFALVATLAGSLYWLVDELASTNDVDTDLVLNILIVLAGGPLVVVLLFGVPFVAYLGNTFARQRLYAVVGLGYLAAMAVSLIGDGEGFLYPQCPEKLVPTSAHDDGVFVGFCGLTGGTTDSLLANYPLSALLLLLPASAALAVSRPVLDRLPPGDRVADWLAVAGNALVVFSAVALAYVVHLTLLLVLVVRNEDVRPSLIVRIIVLLVAIVLAMVARALLGDPARTRATVALLATVLMVLALVNAIVGHESSQAQYSALGLVFGFVLPGLVIYALAGPADVRRVFGSLIPAPAESTLPLPTVPERPGGS